MDQIQPGRTCGLSTEDGVQGLADSMEEVGLLAPVLVRQVGDAYELVAGRRRFETARRMVTSPFRRGSEHRSSVRQVHWWRTCSEKICIP